MVGVVGNRVCVTTDEFRASEMRPIDWKATQTYFAECFPPNVFGFFFGSLLMDNGRYTSTSVKYKERKDENGTRKISVVFDKMRVTVERKPNVVLPLAVRGRKGMRCENIYRPVEIGCRMM